MKKIILLIILLCTITVSSQDIVKLGKSTICNVFNRDIDKDLGLFTHFTIIDDTLILVQSFEDITYEGAALEEITNKDLLNIAAKKVVEAAIEKPSLAKALHTLGVTQAQYILLDSKMLFYPSKKMPILYKLK